MVLHSSIFYNITLRSPLKVNGFFKEYVASIFRVEEYVKQEISMNQAEIRALLCLQLIPHERTENEHKRPYSENSIQPRSTVWPVIQQSLKKNASVMDCLNTN